MLMAKYSLSVADYEALKLSQAGQCAICHDQPARPLHVDHDHGSGRIRGLLCSRCNTGLATFRDDPKLFRAAVAYLKRPALDPLGLPLRGPSLLKWRVDSRLGALVARVNRLCRLPAPAS